MVRDGYDFYENTVLNGAFKRLVSVAAKGVDADLKTSAASILSYVSLPSSLAASPSSENRARRPSAATRQTGAGRVAAMAASGGGMNTTVATTSAATAAVAAAAAAAEGPAGNEVVVSASSARNSAVPAVTSTADVLDDLRALTE
jgi:hypothetical protein